MNHLLVSIVTAFYLGWKLRGHIELEKRREQLNRAIAAERKASTK